MPDSGLLQCECVDFESIPILVDESIEPEALRRPRSFSGRPRVSGQSSQPQPERSSERSRSRPTSHLHQSSSAGISIKIDDDLEMIVSDLQPLRPQASVPRHRGIRPSLPALYLEPFRNMAAEHCSSCKQNFRDGDLRVGYMMEPQLLPQWIHLTCVRRARLQSIGAQLSYHPAVTSEDREEALKELGHPSRNSRILQPWNYLRAFVHHWSTALVHETRPATPDHMATSERNIAEILASLPCEQLQENQEICAICHQQMAAGEIVCILPCGHFYHVGCIDSWLRIRTKCPLDNREIQPEKAELRASSKGLICDCH